LHIENVDPVTEDVNLRVDEKSYCVRKGETLILTDTLMGSRDSTWCRQELIVTRRIENLGKLPVYRRENT